MLQNGLGTLLAEEIKGAQRFVDLFTGSAAVAWFVATRHDVPVIAYDLQSYGSALARAIISRTKPLRGEKIWEKWVGDANTFRESFNVPQQVRVTQKVVKEFRDWSARQKDLPITSAYGGHYFSPAQSLWLDAFRLTLPGDEGSRCVALAALIEAASLCAASPGHTAQPFQPTKTAKPFLQEAWDRDVVAIAKKSFLAISNVSARRIGFATTMDANEAAKGLKRGDLVFVDPPYSGVHYSRFYHVLETLARGECVEVTGVGRYPSQEERPRSKFSVITEAGNAIEDLLETLSAKNTQVILTFPDHECSNGLSGEQVRDIAKKYFRVAEQVVKSRFSTLGGNGGTNLVADGRAARHNARELILALRTK